MTGSKGEQMLALTNGGALISGRGRNYIKTIWAAVCKDYGIHHLYETRREADDDQRNVVDQMNWCGPHAIVKFQPVVKFAATLKEQGHAGRIGEEK